MRALPLLRSALATRALTGRPDRLLGRPAGGWDAAVVRVLGVRQAVQGAAVSRTGWHALSTLVDLLHAASMLLLLAVSPRRWGRFAATQALTAVALIALELRADRRR